jgi:hypothetical protein
LGRIHIRTTKKVLRSNEGQTFLKELSGTWTESDAVNLITKNNSHEQNCKYKSRRNDFHIDEDAYQKLTRYFDAIKRSLSNSSGHDEIIDIEMRVSELLNEKLVNDKQVVGLRDVDAVIAVMGQQKTTL